MAQKVPELGLASRARWERAHDGDTLILTESRDVCISVPDPISGVGEDVRVWISADKNGRLWETFKSGNAYGKVWKFEEDKDTDVHEIPSPGLTTRGFLLEVSKNGKSAVVRLTRKIHLRPLDCWCPEITSKDPIEKSLGVSAKQYADILRESCEGDVVLLLRGQSACDLTKATSMSRFLGRMWLANSEVEFSAAMRQAGHAWATKEEQMAALLLAGAKPKFKVPKLKKK